MRDPVFELMVAITCSVIPVILLQKFVVYDVFGIKEQPFLGQVTIGLWCVLAITLFVLIRRDNIKRDGVCG